MNRRRGIVLTAVVAAAALAIAESFSGADKAFLASFPDNSDIRSKLFSSVLGAPKDLALSFGEKEFQSASGPVLVRTAKRTDDFLVEFRNAAGGLFEETTRGTCIVQRSNAKGNYILQARIFLQDDPTCYLRLYPHPRNGGTLADVVMYGALLKQGMGVEGMIYQVLVKPFPSIVESTQNAFDWAAVFPGSRGGAAAGFPTELAAGGGGSRAAALDAAIESASSFEGFLAAPEARGSTELSSIARAPAGFIAERDEIGPKITLSAFPRYAPGKGIARTALGAIIYLDALDYPDAVYALFGANLRALVVPLFDEAGRFALQPFIAGRAATWDELVPTRADASARVVRLPATLP
jgi:hypothetical protein